MAISTRVQSDRRIAAICNASIASIVCPSVGPSREYSPLVHSRRLSVGNNTLKRKAVIADSWRLFAEDEIDVSLPRLGIIAAYCSITYVNVNVYILSPQSRNFNEVVSSRAKFQAILYIVTKMYCSTNLRLPLRKTNRAIFETPHSRICAISSPFSTPTASSADLTAAPVERFESAVSSRGSVSPNVWLFAFRFVTDACSGCVSKGEDFTYCRIRRNDDSGTT